MKIFLGIIVRQHHRSETDGIAERAMHRVKGGTSDVLFCNYVWMKNGGRISWNAVATCKTCKICCLMGRHWMVEHHPTSAKDLSRLHQFGSNVLPGIFLGYA